jgi:hypothetical protein
MRMHAPDVVNFHPDAPYSYRYGLGVWGVSYRSGAAEVTARLTTAISPIKLS